jgi:hypothetical protein
VTPWLGFRLREADSASDQVKLAARLSRTGVELEAVHGRIEAALQAKPFLLDVTQSARDFLLCEGTDLSYDAGPLERAIKRFLCTRSPT